MGCSQSPLGVCMSEMTSVLPDQSSSGARLETRTTGRVRLHRDGNVSHRTRVLS